MIFISGGVSGNPERKPQTKSIWCESTAVADVVSLGNSRRGVEKSTFHRLSNFYQQKQEKLEKIIS